MNWFCSLDSRSFGWTIINKFCQTFLPHHNTGNCKWCFLSQEYLWWYTVLTFQELSDVCWTLERYQELSEVYWTLKRRHYLYIRPGNETPHLNKQFTLSVFGFHVMYRIHVIRFWFSCEITPQNYHMSRKYTSFAVDSTEKLTKHVELFSKQHVPPYVFYSKTRTIFPHG